MKTKNWKTGETIDDEEETERDGRKKSVLTMSWYVWCLRMTKNSRRQINWEGWIWRKQNTNYNHTHCTAHSRIRKETEREKNCLVYINFVFFFFFSLCLFGKLKCNFFYHKSKTPNPKATATRKNLCARKCHIFVESQRMWMCLFVQSTCIEMHNNIYAYFFSASLQLFNVHAF